MATLTSPGVWQRSRAAVQNVLRMAGGLPNLDSKFATPYVLDTSTVDVALARGLYNNTDPRYKLGAGFARPALNIPVGFMGVPILRVDGRADSTAQQWIDRHLPQWTGAITTSHLHLLRDGDVLLRLRPKNRSSAYARVFTGDDDDLELSMEPSESFEVLHADEDIGSVDGFRVKHLFYVEEGGRMVAKALYETVYADEIILEYENDFRPKRTLPNPLGFVPAVHMSNESLANEMRGHSDLEPIEPYLRFYNDVMLHAGAASKLHSTAKLVLRVQDVARFISNNFTEAEVAEGRLRFRDKDVLFFETGEPDIGGSSAGAAYQEGADIVQARAPLGDTNTLLEYIFLNIVDVSEVPEWAFGGAIASSKASVTEQSAPLIHKVNRKRSLVENHWALMARIGLRMAGISSRVTVEWEDLSQRDTKAEAEAINSLVSALVALNDAEVISKQTMVEELRPYLRKLIAYDFNGDADEKSRILAEAAERAAAVQETLRAESEQLENDDRDAGIRAGGGAGALTDD